MLGHVTFVLVAVVALWGSICSSDVRVPASQLSVRSMLLRSHVRSRFATTVVTSTVVNDDVSGSQEALFEVVLPEEAFIANFSMTVDGEVYPGRVEEKKKAMSEYQEAKKRGQSAGYIKTTARQSNKFDVSVNLKSGSTVTFNLTYQQLLARCHGLYEHKMHVNPGRVVRDLKVEVFVEDARPITKLLTSLKQGLEENSLSEEDARVEKPTPHSRYIVYNPTRDQQIKAGDNGVNGEFVIKYDVERATSAGEVLVVDGYFIHSFAPENYGDLTPVPKDIVFVLDVSGSMTGTKISQLRDAMTTILNELNTDDTFNILRFNDYVSMWKTTLVPVNPNTIREALGHVRNLQADGSTDINRAMTEGVEFLMNHRNRSHVQLVFFLTDGQPTSGVKNPASIANNVERNNEGVASVFGLAFGEGADYNLVKIVSVQNSGFARRIYEAADASEQVKGFYDEISNTMLQNLTINYLKGSVKPDTLTPTTFRYLFKGNDVIVAGKISQDSSHSNAISGVVTAESNGGTINLILDNDTDGIFLSTDPQNNPYFRMPVDFASFTEKTWAYLTIKNLLKEKKKLTYKKDKAADDVDKRILELSLKYKFVTPLTSMVATKPDDKKSEATVKGDEYESKDDTRGPSAYPSYGIQNSHGIAVQASYPRSSNAFISRSNKQSSSPRKSGRRRRPQRPSYADVGGTQFSLRQHYRTPLSGRGISYSYGGAMKKQMVPQWHGPVYAMLDADPVNRYYAKRATVPPPKIAALVPAHTSPIRVTQKQSTVLPQPTHTSPMLVTQKQSTVQPQPTNTSPVLVTQKQPTKPGRRNNKPGSKKPRKSRKNKRTCKLVKIVLEGYGTTASTTTKCVKVKRVQSGTYQLYPRQMTQTTDFSVQATFIRGRHRPNLHDIIVTAKGDNLAYNLTLDPANINTTTWKSPDITFGHVAIHKRVTCRGRRGIAKVFINVHLPDQQDARTRRDVVGRIRNKMKKAKRRSSSFGDCQGPLKKEHLSTRSQRFVSARSSVASPNISIIKI